MRNVSTRLARLEAALTTRDALEGVEPSVRDALLCLAAAKPNIATALRSWRRHGAGTVVIGDPERDDPDGVLSEAVPFVVWLPESDGGGT